MSSNLTSGTMELGTEFSIGLVVGLAIGLAHVVALDLKWSRICNEIIKQYRAKLKSVENRTSEDN